MGARTRIILLAATLGIASVVQAAQTITYTYDARGRVVKVVRTTGSNVKTTTYEHDRANNRRKVKVTGAP